MGRRCVHLIWMACLCALLLSGCLVGAADDSSVPTTDPVTVATTTPTAEPTAPPVSEATTVPTTEPETVPETVPTTVPTQPEGVISLNRDDITFHDEGDEWTLYDGEVEKEKVTFSTDNREVATFIDGVVKAVGEGNTTVRAQYGSQTLSCVIYCVFARETKPADPGDDSPDPTEVTTKPPTQEGGSRDPVKDPPDVFSGPSGFYSNAAFIGDSVSMALRNRANSTGELGSALFLVRGSYSIHHAVEGDMLLTYGGEEMSPEDALAASGVSKVFIMLGMNDVGYYGVSRTLNDWEILLGRIREKNPDIEIYIQSGTPIWTGGERGGLTNSRMDSYNEQLKAFASSHGCHYVDIASYMKDSTNGLATVYCSDSYVHISKKGCDTWIKVLKAYAGY